MGDTWHLDELFVTTQGCQQYLWRAVDEDVDVIDILVQSRRNRHAAVRFFRKLLKSLGCVPRRLITDKLRSYPSARRTVMPSVVHCTDRYANNHAEVSHQPTRQRERQMRGFKSAGHLQRFASVHGVVPNLFRASALATCCGRFTTAFSERDRSSNGMRWPAPAERARALDLEGRRACCLRQVDSALAFPGSSLPSFPGGRRHVPAAARRASYMLPTGGRGNVLSLHISQAKHPVPTATAPASPRSPAVGSDAEPLTTRNVHSETTM